jgi:hypothetical protein
MVSRLHACSYLIAYFHLNNLGLFCTSIIYCLNCIRRNRISTYKTGLSTQQRYEVLLMKFPLYESYVRCDVVARYKVFINEIIYLLKSYLMQMT